MRLALIGAVRTETVGLLSLAGGLLLFIMGYLAGAQSHPVVVAAPQPAPQLAESAPAQVAVAPPADCATPAATPAERRSAPAPIPDRPADVVSPRRVRTTVIKDSPR